MLDSLNSITAASQSIPLATLFEEKRVAILAFLRLIRIVWVIRMGIVIVLYKRHRGFMLLRRFLANTNQMKFEFRDILIWTESK